MTRRETKLRETIDNLARLLAAGARADIPDDVRDWALYALASAVEALDAADAPPPKVSA